MWLSKTLETKSGRRRRCLLTQGSKARGRSSSSADRSAGPGKVLQAAPGVYKGDSAEQGGELCLSDSSRV